MKREPGLFIKILSALVVGVLACLSSASAAPNVIAWGANDAGQTNVPPDVTNAVVVAAGHLHSVALRSDGTVVAWGDNRYGQTNVPPGLTNVVSIAARAYYNLALRENGTLVAWGDQTNVPPELSNVVAIATGSGHSMALRKDGTVVAWGTNFFGQANVPSGLNNVVSIAAGNTYSLALRADGTLIAWGYYLGFEYWNPMYVPASLSNVVAIAAGDEHALALEKDGTIAIWGDSHLGQNLGPTGFTSALTIAAGGSHSIAVQPDGTVFAWGGNSSGQVTVPGWLTNVVGIAAGYAHSLAVVGSGLPFSKGLYADRSVAEQAGTALLYDRGIGDWPLSYQWLFNGAELPGATNAWLVLTPDMMIEAGLYSVIVSNAIGAVTNTPIHLSTVPAVFTEAPRDTVAYLGGTATFSNQVQATQPLSYQWRFDGTDLRGETNATLAVRNATPAKQGQYSVVVSNRFGSVVSRDAALAAVNIAAWGLNDDSYYIFGGQTNVPSILSNAVAVAAGHAHSVALRADGTVLAWGGNESGQTNVPTDLHNVIAIAAGSSHTLALQANGTIVSWGNSPSGMPSDLSNVVAIAAGGFHDVALRADGTVVAWGRDDVGEIDVPPGLSNVVAIACGDAHTLVLCADGTITAWGQYEHFNPTPPIGWVWLPMRNPPVFGQFFDGIASGYSHALGLETDGTVLAWDEDRYGQSDVPYWLTDVVAVAGGQYHSLALRGDGTVFAWGDNALAGQTNVPPDLHNTVAIACGGAHNLALIGTSAPVTKGLLSNPMFNNGAFSVTIPSQSGRVYALEFKNQLSDRTWTALPLAPGTGQNLILTDRTATDASRFYRVQRW